MYISVSFKKSKSWHEFRSSIVHPLEDTSFNTICLLGRRICAKLQTNIWKVMLTPQTLFAWLAVFYMLNSQNIWSKQGR